MATSDKVLVLWARHGQNEANLSRRLSYRRLDPDLTAVGREQAAGLSERLARRLEGIPGPPALFASPMRRAQQTARIVARRLGGDVQTLEGLREVNVGDLDGRGDPAAWEIYASVLHAWTQGRPERSFPGGEDWPELCTRLDAALRYAAERAAGRSAVVVAHGGNIRATLPGLAGVEDPGTDLDLGQFAELEVVNTAAGAYIRLLSWRTATPA